MSYDLSIGYGYPYRYGRKFRKNSIEVKGYSESVPLLPCRCQGGEEI
jgi:hypothetical protein